MRKTGILAFAIGSAFFFSLNQQAYAEVPSELEAEQAEATLDLNAGKYDSAIEKLGALILKSPKTHEFKELRALALKSKGDEKGAIRAYEALIKERRKAGASEREVAPYYFEIGTIQFKDKKYSEAIEAFMSSVEGGFNVTASHFFAGMAAFEGKKYPLAEDYFRDVALALNDDLKPTAHFFLAQTYGILERKNKALLHLVEANWASKKILSNPKLAGTEPAKVAAQLEEATGKALASADKGQPFGFVSLLFGYDSNVLSLPFTLTGAASTETRTPKASINSTIGYMTSPVKSLQGVASYRVSYNYNTNRQTKSGEYLTHIASLNANTRPIAQITTGLKAEGNWTFQNRIRTGYTKQGQAPYLLTGTLGVNSRIEATSNLSISPEFSYSQTKIYDDAAIGDTTRRSGNAVTVKNTFGYYTGYTWFNPAVNGSITWTNTDGSEYVSHAYGLGLNNQILFTDSFSTTLTVDFSHTRYPERPSGLRRDWQYGFGLIANYKINDRWSLTGDTKTTLARSTVPTSYQYDRIVVNAGASMNFF